MWYHGAMKQKAIWTKCSDNTSIREHEMLDACYNCAPFWDDVCPTLPDTREEVE